MIEEVVYSNKQGWGLIADTKEEMAAVTGAHMEPLRLGNTDLTPGKSYDLDGFFARPLEYCGIYKRPTQLFIEITEKGLTEADISHGMVFYICEGNGRHYYQLVAWIDKDRFFMMYGDKFGRDYNFRKGKWK
jgi:hypothetical protein